MKLLNELIADYDMICDIKERYEEMNISNKDKIISAANSLMECFENLIVTTEEIIAENNYNTINTENDNYQKTL